MSSTPARNSSITSVDVDRPVQLLRVERRGDKWWYEVCPDGARFLERHGNRRIAVASVCGLYRTGKSYILNLLLERVQKKLPLFQVGNTTKACTEGLWLYGSLDLESDKSPLLAFIDCEGFGSTSSDRTRDAQLMTLCALLSSVLVLNTKGALNEGLFNALALTCRFAEHVEERGNEASRPMLLWLLRDFQLDLVDESGRPISPSEYLENALRAAPLVTHDVERGQAAAEVRQSLLRFFNQRSCATMVRPAIDEDQLQQLPKLPYDELRKEFRTGLEAVRAQIIQACRAGPKAVGGETISCVSFVALMRQLVTSMNENAVLSVKGAWETIQHSACADLSEQLRGRACSALRALARPGSGGQPATPLTDEAFRDYIAKQRSDFKAEWDKWAVGDEQVRREYWKELEEAMEAEEEAAKERNSRLADSELSKACKAWLEWLDDEQGSWTGAGEHAASQLAAVMERVPSAPLARAARMALQAAGERVAKERGTSATHAARSAEEARRAESMDKSLKAAKVAVSSDLQALKAELEVTKDKLKEALHSQQSLMMDLKARDEELRHAKSQHHAALSDVEALRSLEHEIKAQLRTTLEREADLQANLERAKGDAAQAEQDRESSERIARMARLEAESGGTARVQMEKDLKELRAKHDSTEGLLKRTQNEHKELQTAHEKLRRECEEGEGLAQQKRDAERAEFQQSKEGLRIANEQLEAQSLELKGTKTQLQTALKDVENARGHEREELKKLLKGHSEKEAVWREDLAWAKEAAAKAEAKFLASEKAARKARWEADTAAEERKWLEGEVKRLAGR